MKVWRVTMEDGSTFDVPSEGGGRDAGRSGYGVYEALDASGAIIYTGRTIDLASRLRTHSFNAPWWPYTAEFRWTPCRDYAEAVSLERIAINHDRGLWNLTGRKVLPDSGTMTLPAATGQWLRALYARVDQPFGADDFDTLVGALRQVGWTLQSIAAEVNITRERIRQRAENVPESHDLLVPRPPARPYKAKPGRHSRRKISADVLAEMLELKVLAMKVRGNTPTDSPNRAASERYSELIAEQRLEGVPVSTIARQLGVTPLAINARLARHGYTEPVKGLNQTPYGTSTPGPRATCHRGHPFAGENVRYINGDPKRPVCKTCDRERVRRYRERKQAVA